jgi:hypothetical protein
MALAEIKRTLPRPKSGSVNAIRAVSTGAFVLQTASKLVTHVIPGFGTHRSHPLMSGASQSRSELQFSEGAYEMANLRPARTGLPFVVFISQRAGARHDARVKVSWQPNTAQFVASVSLRPEVEVKEGHLDQNNLDLLRQWIELNHTHLIDFWEGRIEYTEDVLERLQSI